MRWADTPFHTNILQGIPDAETRLGKTSHPRGPYSHIVANKGRKETVLWSVERKDGGRGFGFTGGHFHANWANDEYRKLVLNELNSMNAIYPNKDGVELKVEIP
ncbi:hypothetical protein PQO01_09550 [Lentisphaera marina]|uniref:hypothetical protein n=1 Tax=Lentisphaera marina TaxID=1111041 RepID=UPI0023669C9D|nr:hypothetical protein [Lentisphaera marina]MDD7985194.1 hypothetical protein [Lentisphaera marina]